jgi:putative colanic acid biosynthesis acetyltransferase WcaF
MQVQPTAAEHDPTLLPAFSLQNRLLRGLWNLCWLLLYRTSPRPCHAWRAMLLRLFGARLGPACHFYPRSKIWAPWNLICEDRVTAGDDAELYNPSNLYLESHCIISQGAFLCGATHEYNDPAFPLISFPMRIGAYAWVCARAMVLPRVNIGTGAVLGMGSIATRDLEPFGIYSGNPAVKVKERLKSAVPNSYREPQPKP